MLSLTLLSGVSVIALIIGLYILIKTKKKKKSKMTLKDDLELPLFSLSTITKAASNFSDKNMLGEGGFGSVYKVAYHCRFILCTITDSEQISITLNYHCQNMFSFNISQLYVMIS